jgi:hypothetical protein
MKIDPKIIEAMVDVLAPSIGSEREAELVAPKAIHAALSAGLGAHIKEKAIREAAEVARNWRRDLVIQNVARGWATQDIAAAILALLDKPAPDGGQL